MSAFEFIVYVIVYLLSVRNIGMHTYNTINVVTICTTVFYKNFRISVVIVYELTYRKSFKHIFKKKKKVKS